MQTQDQLLWLMLCSGHSQHCTGSVGWSRWWLWRRDSHTSLSNSLAPVLPACSISLNRSEPVYIMTRTPVTSLIALCEGCFEVCHCLTARCPLGSGSKPENQNLARLVEPEGSWRRSREQHRLLQSVTDTVSPGKHTFSVTLNIFLVQPFTKWPRWHTLDCDSGKWNWLRSSWNLGVSPLWSMTEPVWGVCVWHTVYCENGRLCGRAAHVLSAWSWSRKFAVNSILSESQSKTWRLWWSSEQVVTFKTLSSLRTSYCHKHHFESVLLFVLMMAHIGTSI